MKNTSANDGRMPTAAWAWQGLRRNPDYRRAFFASKSKTLRPVQLRSGATLLRANQRFRDAEAFGLLCFADPDVAAVNANLFWRPDLLAGSLRVQLEPQDTNDPSLGEPHDEIVLSALQTRRTLLETSDGIRHILLSGERFWVQLFCDKPAMVGEHSIVKIRIDGAKHGMRRLDTAAQLLSLHRSIGGSLSLIGRRKKPTSIIRALGAYDIYHGFERPKGDLEDIAAFITGNERVAQDWTKDRNLRVQTRRWIDRGEEFVRHGYRDLLTLKTI